MEALTIPVKLYVHYTSNTYIENNWLVSTGDMSQLYPDQYVLICIRDVNIEIEQPEPIDIIGLQVTQLNNQKENVISKAQQEINLLEDKIQQLLCIEHSPIEENEFPF